MRLVWLAVFAVLCVASGLTDALDSTGRVALIRNRMKNLETSTRETLLTSIEEVTRKPAIVYWIELPGCSWVEPLKSVLEEVGMQACAQGYTCGETPLRYCIQP